MEEGLRFVIPFFSKVEIVSLKLAEDEAFVSSFTTKDGLRIETKSSFQYRPNPYAFGDDERNIFVTVDQKTIQDGVRAVIGNHLGILAGQKEYTSFIQEREAISEAVLRFLKDRIQVRYGIVIESFFLINVSFSSAMQTALEVPGQTRHRAQAAGERVALAKQFKDEVGVSPQTAVDEADVAIDPSIRKDVVSVRGESGILGAIVGSVVKKENKR